jgi:hypothetical protein
MPGSKKLDMNREASAPLGKVYEGSHAPIQGAIGCAGEERDQERLDTQRYPTSLTYFGPLSASPTRHPALTGPGGQDNILEMAGAAGLEHAASCVNGR